MAKKCPFKKVNFVTQYHWEGDTPLPFITEEYFGECYGEECMAYIKATSNFCELTKGSLDDE